MNNNTAEEVIKGFKAELEAVEMLTSSYHKHYLSLADGPNDGEDTEWADEITRVNRHLLALFEITIDLQERIHTLAVSSYIESVASVFDLKHEKTQLAGHTCEDCGGKCKSLTDVSGLPVGECCISAYTLG